MTDTIKSYLEKECISKLSEFFGPSKKILLFTNNPEKYQNILNKKELSFEVHKLELFETESTHESSLDESYLKTITKNNNYDVIVLDQIIELLPPSSVFLKNISKFLSSNGVILGCVYNFSNIINRIKFLDGELHPKKSTNTNFSLFSLKDILLFLLNSNLKITKLDRIKKKITTSNQIELKNYVLPLELIDSINNDPESETFFYIFNAIPNSNISSQTRKSISEFSKNLVTEKLHEIFEQQKIKHQKEIAYLKQSNREQYDLIKFLKNALSDKDEYIDQIIKIIKDKDAYAEQIIKDKDAYAEQIIKDKDEIINALQNSSAFKLIRTIEKLRGKKS